MSSNRIPIPSFASSSLAVAMPGSESQDSRTTRTATRIRMEMSNTAESNRVGNHSSKFSLGRCRVRKKTTQLKKVQKARPSASAALSSSLSLSLPDPEPLPSFNTTTTATSATDESKCSAQSVEEKEDSSLPQKKPKRPISKDKNEVQSPSSHFTKTAPDPNKSNYTPETNTIHDQEDDLPSPVFANTAEPISLPSLSQSLHHDFTIESIQTSSSNSTTQSLKPKLARHTKPNSHANANAPKVSHIPSNNQNSNTQPQKQPSLPSSHTPSLPPSHNQTKTHTSALSSAKRTSHLSSSINPTQKKQKLQSEPLPTTNKRPNIKRTKKHKPCVLCSTCPCSRGSSLKYTHDIDNHIQPSTALFCKTLHDTANVHDDDALDNPNATATATATSGPLARSDKEIEMALLKRLVRLEKSVAWFDHLRYKVERELKKHRSAMLKRFLSMQQQQQQQHQRKGACDGDKNDQSDLFIPDVDDVNVEQLYHVRFGIMDKKSVREAKEKLFGPPKKMIQPTLTQLLSPEKDRTKSNDLLSLSSSSERDANDPNSSQHDDVNNKSVIESDDESDIDEDGTNDDNPTNEKASKKSKDALPLSPYSSPVPSNPFQDLDKAYRLAKKRLNQADVCRSGVWSVVDTKTDCGELLQTRPNSKPKMEEEKDCARVVCNDDSSMKYERGNSWEKRANDAILSSSDSGLDELLRLFEVDASTATKELVGPNPRDKQLHDKLANSEHSCSQENSTPLQSQLSQQGMEIYNDILSTSNNVAHDMQQICPQWKENIHYALRRKDVHDISHALDNVNRTRCKLGWTKDEIFNVFCRYDCLLKLYELALTQSLHRRRRRDNEKHRSAEVDTLPNKNGVPGSNCSQADSTKISDEEDNNDEIECKEMDDNNYKGEKDDSVIVEIDPNAL